MRLPLPMLPSYLPAVFYNRPIDEKLAAIVLPRGTMRGELQFVPPPKELGLFAGEIREAVMSKPNGLACPDCSGVRVVRYGKRKGVQRYRCNDCRRYFNDLTGTVLQGIHLRNEFFQFYVCMLRGLSVREAARRIGISKNTSFDWRHRIISRLEIVDSMTKLSGIVEIAQRSMPISYKGSQPPMLVTGKTYASVPRYKLGFRGRFRPEREGYMLLAVDRSGRVRVDVVARPIGRTFEDALSKMTSPDAYVCARREPGSWPTAQEYPKPINWVGGSRARGCAQDTDANGPLYHTDHARALLLAFRNWMRRFCGVATKYVLRYASWFFRVLSLGQLNDRLGAKILLFETLSV